MLWGFLKVQKKNRNFIKVMLGVITISEANRIFPYKRGIFFFIKVRVYCGICYIPGAEDPMVKIDQLQNLSNLNLFVS